MNKSEKNVQEFPPKIWFLSAKILQRLKVWITFFRSTVGHQQVVEMPWNHRDDMAFNTEVTKIVIAVPRRESAYIDVSTLLAFYVTNYGWENRLHNLDKPIDTHQV